jgi:bisphosphoglycerate-dependent phosphoglycerate mutase
MLLKLVRHGLSKANTGEVDPLVCGDFRVPLSDIGIDQARKAGATIGPEFLSAALVYTSPYLRARQTLHGLLEGAGLPIEPGDSGSIALIHRPGDGCGSSFADEGALFVDESLVDDLGCADDADRAEPGSNVGR